MIATIVTELKNCPRGPGTNSDVLHSGIFFIATLSQQSLESGFHMIATIATIVEIELTSISIVVATIATIVTIAEEWFPYDRNDR